MTGLPSTSRVSVGWRAASRVGPILALSPTATTTSWSGRTYLRASLWAAAGSTRASFAGRLGVVVQALAPGPGAGQAAHDHGVRVEHARQREQLRVARVLQLGRGDGRLADPLDLGEQIGHRRAGDVRADAAPDAEGAQVAAGLEVRVDAVGVALHLAQGVVDPAGEVAAQHGVGHRQRGEVGVGGLAARRRPRSSAVWRRARLVHQHQAGGRGGGRGRSGRLAGRAASAFQPPRRACTARFRLVEGDVPGHHQRRLVGAVVGAPEAQQVLACWWP